MWLYELCPVPVACRRAPPELNCSAGRKSASRIMSDLSEHTTESERNGEPFQEAADQTKLPIILAMFDVLGFSARLEREGLDRVLTLYNELVETTIKRHEQEKRWESGFRPIGESPEGTLMIPVLFGLPLRYAYFSDTILLWVPLVQMFVRPFIAHCATFMCEALNMRVPIRGSLALGEAVMHRQSSTYLGQPLVDAARLESAQKWLGGAFSISATWPEFLAEIDPRLIVEYDVPVKESTAPGTLTPVVLDWPRRWRELYDIDPRQILEEMARNTPHPYYENTIAFSKHSLENENWYLRTEEQMSTARLKMCRGTRPGGSSRESTQQEERTRKS